ncbi:MAG: family 20 glycosylhydrolase, partial [Anaerohalosphaera sp.]|nr:family 20 glycosylhydrolase [Anaerohalosphaera sp.]
MTRLIVSVIIVLLSTTAANALASTDINIIPAPAKVKIIDGQFELTDQTAIVYLNEVKPVAQYLREHLKPATGYNIKLIAVSDRHPVKPANTISLNLTLLGEVLAFGKEGYILKVLPAGVEIRACDPAGLFYGVQSLLQLLPKEIESSSKVNNVKWTIPCIDITDDPRFGWRGLLLDVSRHFFTKDEVKQYIDTMARYKLNTFHWHLTDDQGWRIEIKKYPKLTEVGAWRVPRQGCWWTFDPPKPGEKPTDGGFYTQEDIAEIVEYAKARFITIVPEIDVPGHSMAALASYPELSCGGGPFDVNPGSKFYGQIENTLCPSNDKVYKFMDDVFTEIAQMFPGQYIHMGGDEAHKGFWKKCKRCQKFKKDNSLKDEHELQSHFVKQVEKILESKGKKLVGWDEILEGGLAPNATVMSWRGIAGGVKSAKMGHHVVMTPSPYYYLDLYQSDPIVEPKTYSLSRLNTCYKFEPVPDGIEPKLILGVQGNVWSEEISEIRHAQYMTWPRGLAIAETAWTPKEKKDWENFAARVENQFARMDIAQVKYARSMFDAIFKPTRDKDGRLVIELETELDNIDIHYTFEGADPDNYYPKYEKPLTVPANAQNIIVSTYRDGMKVGKQINMP